MIRRSLRSSAFLAGLLALAPAACSDSSGEDCSPGALGCMCANMGQCLNGLSCFSNVCVDAAASASGSAEGSATTPTTDPDLTTTDPTTTSESDTNDTANSEGSEAGGPKILQFLTNVNKITEGESVTFTVVVTDPDGVQDVIGGSLTSSDGKVAFGAFATSGEEGAYELTLAWSEIHQATPIQFETPSTVQTFRAEFFDQGGKSAWRTADITLSCEDDARVTPSACEGKCRDLDSDDEHCTHCGIACKVDSGVGHCEKSTCTPTYTGCVFYENFVNCNETCASSGETCVVGGCNGSTSYSYLDDICENTYQPNYDHACNEDVGGSYTACCCTQTI